MNLSQNNKRLMAKGLINGAVLAAGATAIYGGGNVEFFNMNVPSAIPLAVIGATASISNELIHQNLLGTPSISTSYLVSDYSSLAINAGVAGGLTTALMSTAVGLPSSNYMGAFALGSGSVLATEMIERRFLESPQGQLIF